MTTQRQRCRLLPFATSDGPGNMAADEVLLAAARAGTASLRFYGWRQATLSLGYFQPAALRETDSLLTRLPWVRRCTGGEALVHHHELTYALALPPGSDWQQRYQPWLFRMHAIIQGALFLESVFLRGCCPGEERKLGDVLCFLHQTPGDLLCGESKVVGSAQRKQRGALLQHGAILLAQSPYTPSLPGLRELTGFDPQRMQKLQWDLETSFEGDTGWHLEPADWTDAELAQIAELAESKYRQASWNGKR